MPSPARAGSCRYASRRPARMSWYRPRMSQYSPSGSRTAPLRKRRTWVRSSRPGPTRPSMTRPLDAPRSTAARLISFALIAPPVLGISRARSPRGRRGCVDDSLGKPRSSEEGGGDAGVDGDVQAGGLGQIAGGEREQRGRDVLGQHLLAQQGALGVVGAQVLLLDPVHGGAGGAPAAGEDPGAADHAVRVDAVDPDA